MFSNQRAELNLPLARAAVDRDYLSRARPELFDELWADPRTRVLAMSEGRVLLHQQDAHTLAELKLLEVEQVPSAKLRVYLGKSTIASNYEESDTPVVLAVLSKNAADNLEPDQPRCHSGLRRSHP